MLALVLTMRYMKRRIGRGTEIHDIVCTQVGGKDAYDVSLISSTGNVFELCSNISGFCRAWFDVAYKGINVASLDVSGSMSHSNGRWERT